MRILEVSDSDIGTSIIGSQSSSTIVAGARVAVDAGGAGGAVGAVGAGGAGGAKCAVGAGGAGGAVGARDAGGAAGAGGALLLPSSSFLAFFIGLVGLASTGISLLFDLVETLPFEDPSFLGSLKSELSLLDSEDNFCAFLKPFLQIKLDEEVDEDSDINLFLPVVDPVTFPVNMFPSRISIFV